MSNHQGNLFTRDDTFFGVCEGLGQDLGVSPLWFRVAFPLALFFNPVMAAAAYAAAGALVLASRLLFPDRRRAAAAVTPEPAIVTEPANEPQALPLAA